MSNPNPMNSRCGLEGCDCGYVIEKLLEALEETSYLLDALGEVSFGSNKAAVELNGPADERISKAVRQADAAIKAAKGDA